MKTTPTEERRWREVQERNAEAQFVYAVSTTGVYCRPGCPSRLPLRCHVTFHDTPGQAEREGYRACRRCHPGSASIAERHEAAVARACRILESSGAAPGLKELAAAVGLSRHHFRRVFVRVVGISPREFAAALRARRVRVELRKRPKVTEAIYAAGFGSGSRFYEGNPLGMTALEYTRGGRGVSIRCSIAKGPLGLVLMAATARGICSVRFGGTRAALERELRAEFPRASILPADATLRAWMRSFLRNPSTSSSLPLDIRGTAFQQRVWKALRRIPPGRTSTYTELAAHIGRPRAVRAVARACATNPAAVLVPCHRAVGKNGSLRGYRWGLHRKRQLLRAESAPL